MGRFGHVRRPDMVRTWRVRTCPPMSDRQKIALILLDKMASDMICGFADIWRPKCPHSGESDIDGHRMSAGMSDRVSVDPVRPDRGSRRARRGAASLGRSRQSVRRQSLENVGAGVGPPAPGRPRDKRARPAGAISRICQAAALALARRRLSTIWAMTTSRADPPCLRQ